MYHHLVHHSFLYLANTNTHNQWSCKLVAEYVGESAGPYADSFVESVGGNVSIFVGTTDGGCVGDNDCDIEADNAGTMFVFIVGESDISHSGSKRIICNCLFFDFDLILIYWIHHCHH
eukprot:529737_1